MLVVSFCVLVDVRESVGCELMFRKVLVVIKICELCGNLHLKWKSVGFLKKVRFLVFKTRCVFSYPILETRQLEIVDLMNSN